MAFFSLVNNSPLLRTRVAFQRNLSSQVYKLHLRAFSQPAFCSESVDLRTSIGSQLQEIKTQGTYKLERVITSPQTSSVTVEPDNAEVLNFCANNYLGLCDHPEVVSAAKRAIDEYGFGLASVRFICGTQDIHKKLEKSISDFHQMDDAILYPSCFDANAGLFEAILGPNDAVISDELNHASIIDGIRLCKADRYRYKHLDMSSLEECLVKSQDKNIRLVVTDGVFSMDGDIAPLRDICSLAEKYKAYVFIDECHATGFVGATGRGTIEHCGVDGRVAIINSTLGKALGGGTGGYTTGPQEVIDLLRQKSRPYLFSNTVTPSVVGASLKVFEMLQDGNTVLVDKVRKNTHMFRDKLSSAGFDIRGCYDHPIVPIMLRDAKLASEFASRMLSRNIYVIGFSYPVVPMGQARIRTQISAAHSEKDIDKATSAFYEVGKELGVI
mmetsp:Transcript_15073/g.17060  ORF Transcript_15073/g.17060 Transcript_15073/m.17060 type:complete len:441 (+) Transcript_15073:159-1481(+)